MYCLEDWIGIEGCASAPSNSGYYINSMAGISQARMAQIADSEQSTFVGVWDDIQTRAILRFKSDFNSYMMQRFRKSDSVASFKINKNILDTSSSTAATADYLGVLLTTDPYSSPLLAQHIQSVTFYIDAVNGDVVIKVWDITEGNEANVVLDTFTIAAADLVVGWNTKYINTTYYDSINIFVGFQHTNYASYATNIEPNYYLPNNGFLQGARFTTSGDTLTIGQNTFGICLTGNLQCRYESYVCNNLDLFTNAWMNLCAAELMKERMYTDQINAYTTINFDKAKQLYELYEKTYSDQMQLIVSGIALDCDWCLECNSLVSVVDNLP